MFFTKVRKYFFETRVKNRDKISKYRQVLKISGKSELYPEIVIVWILLGLIRLYRV